MNYKLLRVNLEKKIGAVFAIDMILKKKNLIVRFHYLCVCVWGGGESQHMTFYNLTTPKCFCMLVGSTT